MELSLHINFFLDMTLYKIGKYVWPELTSGGIPLKIHSEYSRHIEDKNTPIVK